jgi:3-hydroxyisobutyrate dehydrogenase-like beta-hydroxyacid dehydrogenase
MSTEATRPPLGILHPGEMGLSVAATAQNSGHPVYWASMGRSAQTAERAAKRGLLDAQTVAGMVERCPIIVSVCPPDAAESVAEQVLAHGFRGLYVEMNAISPARTVRIGARMAAAGVRFVDGGIIGGPAWQPQRTWAYLAGDHAAEAAACFAVGPLETSILGREIGKASALKMCFAAYSKGTTALLSAVLGAAEALNVREALAQQWARDEAAFPDQAAQRTRGVTAKAWRFAGEMDEIASTFREAGLPSGFHEAAADVYRRMAAFKGASALPSLDEVLAALLRENHD